MKIGIRKPSLKKSIKARTTGRAKRAIKSSVNPLYGKKGIGLINNPKKAVYNKIYNKTTMSAVPGTNYYSDNPLDNNSKRDKTINKDFKLGRFLGILIFIFGSCGFIVFLIEFNLLMMFLAFLLMNISIFIIKVTKD